MRRLIPFALILLAACTGSTGDATTTAPSAEPSTTSTTAPSTTTTTGQECVERDGLQKDPRGFICPPWMWANGLPEVGDPIHLPGSYETRFFEPAFSFLRDDRFSSLGENPGKAVALDGATYSPWIYAIGSDLVRDVQSVDFGALEWVTDLWKTEVEILGFPAAQVDFVVAQDCETFTRECRIPAFEDLHISIASWSEADKVRILILDRPEGPVAFEITAGREDFDTYWTEVARPILDSIEFIGP